jgi:ATP-dependent Clp protease ATP-binding subunit ClpX
MKLTRPEPVPVPTPRRIVAHLDRFVVGQEEAKRTLALAAYAHLRRTDLARRHGDGTWRKSNVLMVGPTGSGKTLLARHLAGVMRAPFVTADATEYTEAGYYGRDVELMMTDLYARAGHDVDEARRGVIFIDEIDKLARRAQGAQSGAGSRDIGGEGVQQALLKLLEGREVVIPAATGQAWSRQESVVLDTSDVLFICAGTFSDLHESAAARRAIGFGVDDRARSPRIGARELQSFGMLSELLGRLPVVVRLDELGPRELERVLTEPDDAIVREYRQRLSLDGIELVVRATAMREVAQHAHGRRLGARGLRGLMESVFADALFDAPERGGSRLVMDAAFVRRRLRVAEGA